MTCISNVAMAVIYQEGSHFTPPRIMDVCMSEDKASLQGKEHTISFSRYRRLIFVEKSCVCASLQVPFELNHQGPAI